MTVTGREAKSKGEKERYKHLNAEFQRIARRHKKAFLSDQCKGIEEKNRVGKTRGLFKKIRESKEESKEPLDEGERSEKSGLKLNIQKTRIMISGPIISWQI